jgi:hypothetical protein
MMDRFAERVSTWFGSAPFITLITAWFLWWNITNRRQFTFLTCISELAIWLSLFILRGQSAQAGRMERAVHRDLEESKELKKLVKSQR